MKTLDIHARKVLATNSKPTIEIEIQTQHGTVRASAPMGTSTGKYESFQLPVDDAIRKFHMIRSSFTSQDFKDQMEVDEKIRTVDNTSFLREMGSNLAVAISSAFLKAFALEENIDVWQYVSKTYSIQPKIPMPLCNIVGGWHGRNDFQEFLFLPVHQNSFSESLFKITKAYASVGEMIKEKDSNFDYGKNIESAWVTSLNYMEILEIMKKVAVDGMLKIGIDAAASQIYSDRVYHYSGGDLNSHEQLSFIERIVRKFPISYMEDPFSEDDWLSFSTATSRWQPRMVCGDDFYATRIHRLLSGIDRKATNAVIVKPNQIGTITDTVEFAKEAKKHGMMAILSHRSGENDDALASHLAVGMGCDYAKLGISGERVVKLNEILRIEDKMMMQDEKRMPSKIRDLTESLKKLKYTS